MAGDPAVRTLKNLHAIKFPCCTRTWLSPLLMHICEPHASLKVATLMLRGDVTKSSLSEGIIRIACE